MGRAEGNVEDYLRDTFRLGGWKVYKCAWGGGAYDRLAVSPRAFHLYVELKRPGKDVLDPAQVKWRDDMFKRIQEGGCNNIALEGPVNCRAQIRGLYERYRDR